MSLGLVLLVTSLAATRTLTGEPRECVALIDQITTTAVRVVGLPHEPHKTPATFWVKLSEGRFHPAARGVQHTLHTRKLALRALQPEV